MFICIKSNCSHVSRPSLQLLRHTEICRCKQAWTHLPTFWPGQKWGAFTAQNRVLNRAAVHTGKYTVHFIYSSMFPDSALPFLQLHPPTSKSILVVMSFGCTANYNNHFCSHTSIYPDFRDHIFYLTLLKSNIHLLHFPVEW